MLLGCAVGAFFAGRLADRWGRRAVLIIAAVMFLLSALGAGAAGSFAVFIAARVLGGFAVGAASVMSPAYIAEVASARYRGRLATVQQIAIISGLFCAFLSNFLLARPQVTSTDALWLGHEAWRWMFWMQAVPSLVFLVLLLADTGKPALPGGEAAQGRRAGGADAAVRSGRSAGQARRDRSFVVAGPSPSAPVRPRQQGHRQDPPIVWIGIGLATFQQLVGINVVFYYGAVLWQAVGFSENDALLINVFSGALSIGACLVALVLIDRIGRKPLLWIGSLGMAVSLALVTWAFASASVDSPASWS